MRAANRSPRTITERTNLVRRVARDMETPAEALGGEQVSAWLAGTTPGARPTYYAHLHAWFTWLARQQLRLDVPTLTLDRPKVGRREPRTISTGHVRALVDSGIWTRTRTMVFLGAYQGLRASEIAGLRGSDVDIIGDELVVTGKGT